MVLLSVVHFLPQVATRVPPLKEGRVQGFRGGGGGKRETSVLHRHLFGDITISM